MSTDVIVAFISGLAGPLMVTVAQGVINRKARNDAADGAREVTDGVTAGGEPRVVNDPDTLAGVVVKWAKQLEQDVMRVQARVTELETEVERLRAENARLRRHAEILSGQVVDLGGKPWRLPE